MEMLDFIVVGQGIAGTVLGLELLKRQKKVIIINHSSYKSSSEVAAGIYNPITGKRSVKSWKSDLLFPSLENFYKDNEQLLGSTFLHPMPIYKPFSSVAEQNHCVSTLGMEEGLADISLDVSKYKDFIYDEFGGFKTQCSGYVNVKKLLAEARNHFQGLAIYKETPFQYHDIVIKEHGIFWKGYEAKKILFCEGAHAIKNPFFNWLPFVLTKGELLTISIEHFPEDVIFSKSVFLVPTEKQIYKTGSTYEWQYHDEEVSEKAKKELVTKLEMLVKKPYHIIGQESGLRPTVRDRRPLIGIHPQYPGLGIFNGLGTKGVSLAPYFARCFADFLESGKELEQEVNIQRHYSLL
jgi:glycine/D-amino acid oxidase-like deaminating enzyme